MKFAPPSRTQRRRCRSYKEDCNTVDVHTCYSPPNETSENTGEKDGESVSDIVLDNGRSSVLRKGGRRPWRHYSLDNTKRKSLVVLAIMLVAFCKPMLLRKTKRLDSPRPNKETDARVIGPYSERAILQSSNSYELDCSRDIRYFQVYHISKCGGTNLREVLRLVFELRPQKEHRWSFNDFGIWRKERENYADSRYKGNPDSQRKKQVFIVGLVRNPFAVYRSLHSMQASRYVECKRYMKTDGASGDFENCTCEMKLAYRLGKSHLFYDQPNLRNNVTAFHEYVEFLLGEDASEHCSVSMQSRHDNLMRMNDGSMAYDYVVKQENYYPMIREALRRFHGCVPNVTQFDTFDILEESNLQRGNRENFMQQSSRTEYRAPDFCYYSPHLRKLVEGSDGNMMKLYNYTWDGFVGNGSREDCVGMIV